MADQVYRATLLRGIHLEVKFWLLFPSATIHKVVREREREGGVIKRVKERKLTRKVKERS